MWDWRVWNNSILKLKPGSLKILNCQSLVQAWVLWLIQKVKSISVEGMQMDTFQVLVSQLTSWTQHSGSKFQQWSVDEMNLPSRLDQIEKSMLSEGLEGQNGLHWKHVSGLTQRPNSGSQLLLWMKRVVLLLECVFQMESTRLVDLIKLDL